MGLDPNDPNYESTIEFMRADLECNMGLSKIVDAAKKAIESGGGNFIQEFEKWKRSNK